jgi:hypothetical protein
VASDKDVLGKADALLKRHGQGGSDPGGVPVLTELVHDPRAKAAIEELSREIFNRVMAEVEGRLAADLEKRLVQHPRAPGPFGRRERAGRSPPGARQRHRRCRDGCAQGPAAKKLK